MPILSDSVPVCTTPPPTRLTKEAAEGERSPFWVLSFRDYSNGSTKKFFTSRPIYFEGHCTEGVSCLHGHCERTQKKHSGLYNLLMAALWTVKKEKLFYSEGAGELGWDGWEGLWRPISSDAC